MKISSLERSFLLKKYRQEGLNYKEINQRLISLDLEQEMIKFNKRKPRKTMEMNFNDNFRKLGKI